MNREEALQIVAEARKKGERPDLYMANLRNADLSDANLRGANLHRADLRGANLSGADLSDANLSYANLYMANLSRADLRGADLDVASWPLWCGSFNLQSTDDRLTAQMVRHTREVAKANSSEYGRAVFEALHGVDKFHEYRKDVKPIGNRP